MKSLLIGLLLLAVMPCAGQAPVQKSSSAAPRYSYRPKPAFNYLRLRDLQPGYVVETPRRFYFTPSNSDAQARLHAEIRYSILKRRENGYGFLESFISGMALGVSISHPYQSGSLGDGGDSWASFILGTGLGLFMGSR